MEPRGFGYNTAQPRAAYVCPGLVPALNPLVCAPVGPPWADTTSGTRAPSRYPTGSNSTPSTSRPSFDFQVITRDAPIARSLSHALVVVIRVGAALPFCTYTSPGMSGVSSTMANLLPSALTESPCTSTSFVRLL